MLYTNMQNIKIKGNLYINKFPYFLMLGKTELRVLCSFSEGDALKDIAEKVKISKGKASVAVKNLEKLGFIIRERQNKRIFLKMGNTKHASLFFDFLKEYSSLPVEKLLPQRRIAMLSIIENEPSVISKIIGISCQTVYNAIKDFLRYGILIKRNGYEINPRHRILKEFVIEFQSFLNRMEIANIDKEAILIWERGPEFLIKTPKRIKDKNYHLTALSEFKKFGLLFIPSHNYYFYSGRDIAISDIIIHTILIEPESKRNVAYACLLYQKTKPEDLIKVAKIYKMEEKAEKIIKYVDKKQDFDDFPKREDYNELLEEYEVIQ